MKKMLDIMHYKFVKKKRKLSDLIDEPAVKNVVRPNYNYFFEQESYI